MPPDSCRHRVTQVLGGNRRRVVAYEIGAQPSLKRLIGHFMNDRLRDPRNGVKQPLDLAGVDKLAGDSYSMIDAAQMNQTAIFVQPSQVSRPVAPHTISEGFKPLRRSSPDCASSRLPETGFR